MRFDDQVLVAAKARLPSRALIVNLTGGIFFRLERQVAHTFGCIGDLPDRSPGLFVVGDDEFVDARGDHVALYASRIGEQHEGLFALGRRRGVHDRLSRAVVVVDLDEIASFDVKFCHVLGMHLYEGIRPAKRAAVGATARAMRSASVGASGTRAAVAMVVTRSGDSRQFD